MTLEELKELITIDKDETVEVKKSISRFQHGLTQ